VSYRQTVGPTVTWAPKETAPLLDSERRLIVVDWNVHVGNGDVLELVDSITNDELRYAIGLVMLAGWLLYFYMPRGKRDGAPA